MRRAWKAFLALALSVVFSALLLECGVRVLLGEQVKFPRRVVGTDFGVRVNQPDVEYRHKSSEVEVWFRINSRGMRADRDYPYEKPAGTIRIVSLGDSFTAGYEVEFEETFSQVVERELRALGYDVEVLNAGVSGYSNAEALLYLERELLKYDPDLVLLSFYGNDLSDNVRSQLFVLEDGQLRPDRDSYVPAGGLGDFLNTNALFNWLSGYSDAFAMIKETATRVMKWRTVRENLDVVASAEAQQRGEESAPDVPARVAYQRELGAAILEELYALTRREGIPLVVQSIPNRERNPERLIEAFPLEQFDVDRPGLLFFPAKDVLDAWVGRETLYHLRSHGHWTPLAHDVAGRELARRIAAAGLLSSAETRPRD